MVGSVPDSHSGTGPHDTVTQYASSPGIFSCGRHVGGVRRCRLGLVCRRRRRGTYDGTNRTAISIWADVVGHPGCCPRHGAAIGLARGGTGGAPQRLATPPSRSRASPCRRGRTRTAPRFARGCRRVPHRVLAGRLGARRGRREPRSPSRRAAQPGSGRGGQPRECIYARACRTLSTDELATVWAPGRRSRRSRAT